MTRRSRRLRLDRLFLGLLSPATARTNASEACARLQERRHEREDVDAYFRSLVR